MADVINTPDPEGGHYETEVTYEVIEGGGNRRRLLAIILVILVLLLIGASVLVWNMTRPAGAPTAEQTDGLRWVRSIYAWGDAPETLLSGPVDAAVAPDGTIWTVSGKTTLVGFKPDGTLEKLVPFERGLEDGQVISIEGLDVDEDGNIYLCDYGRNFVHVLSPEGEMQLSIGIQLPSEVSVRGDRMAVAAANGIAVMSTNGELISQWGSRGNAEDQVDIPHGIVWVDDDTILVSDTHNRRIKAYSPDGRLKYIAPEGMTTAPKAGLQGTSASQDATLTPYQLPSSMTLDSAGRVLLVDPFVFAVMHVNPDTGELVEQWGEFGATDGTFAYPTGIDYDVDRDYFVVADTANNRLQIIEVPGSGGSLLAKARRTLDGPIWLCSIPLLLLVLALILWVSKRRRRARQETEIRADEA